MISMLHGIEGMGVYFWNSNFPTQYSPGYYYFRAYCFAQWNMNFSPGEYFKYTAFIIYL